MRKKQRASFRRKKIFFFTFSWLASGLVGSQFVYLAFTAIVFLDPSLGNCEENEVLTRCYIMLLLLLTEKFCSVVTFSVQCVGQMLSLYIFSQYFFVYVLFCKTENGYRLVNYSCSYVFRLLVKFCLYSQENKKQR